MGQTLRAASFAEVTDIGRKRARNEDRTLTNPRIMAVADGMGGHTLGDQAAEFVVDALDTEVSDLPVNGANLAQMSKRIKSALANAADQISHLGGTDAATNLGTVKPFVAGSTVAGLAFADLPVAFHVGDSRVYRYRQHAGGSEFIRVTRDHSVVQRMVDAGELTDAEAHVHPKKNIITRAIGTYGEPQVEFTTLDLEVGDIVLICSDGLSDEVEDLEIHAIIDDTIADGVQMTAYALRDVAIASGGRDNITVVLVEIGDAEQ